MVVDLMCCVHSLYSQLYMVNGMWRFSHNRRLCELNGSTYVCTYMYVCVYVCILYIGMVHTVEVSMPVHMYVRMWY